LFGRPPEVNAVLARDVRRVREELETLSVAWKASRMNPHHRQFGKPIAGRSSTGEASSLVF
jgi:hypothetical protein